jgi:L-aspartate oxidase
LHLLASALVAAAILRTETRGSHWREDFPEPSDDWIGHLIVTLGDGSAGDGLKVSYVPDEDPRPKGRQ